MFVLDPHSEQRLSGVHPDLVRVVRQCVEDWALPFRFGISQGLRTPEMEAKYVASGRSQTMNSRHLPDKNGVCYAIDVCALLPPDNEVCWTWHLYEQIADAMKIAADKCAVPVIWGGSWLTLKDGCHFELPRDRYPAAT